MAIASPDTTLTGTLTDPQGNTISGTLTFTLEGFGSTVPLIAGSQAITGLTFTTAVTAGVFSATFYSNQIITPGPLVTFYNISFQPSATTTTVFAFSENFQFSPGVFDLSQIVPINATIPNRASSTQATPNVFTAQNGQFLTGLTPSSNFTTGPTNLVLEQSNGVYGWSSSSVAPLAAADTGLSRSAAGVVMVGNGTQGNNTGTLNLTTVNAVTLAPFNAGAAIPSSSSTAIYGTGTGGGAFPFLEAGSLVLQARTSGALRDILFCTGNPGVFQWAVKRTGTLTGISANPINWVAASDLSASPDTGISRTAAATVAVGNGTQGDVSGTLKGTVISLADGTTSAPSYSFTSSTNTGLFQFGAGNLGIVTGGVGRMQFISSGVFLPSGLPLSWEVGVLNSGTDTGLSRISAGLLAVGNGTQGDFSGTVKAGNEILTAAAPTVAASQVGLGSTTATTATSGAQTLPANPAGFLIINVAGTAQKIPYYNT